MKHIVFPRPALIELSLIFGLLPVVISIVKPHGWLVFIIWAISAYSWFQLKKLGYRWNEEWNRAALH